MISQLIKSLYNIVGKIEPFNIECLSTGQLLSKEWLVAELEKFDLNLGTVFLCAGWYATLATMILESPLIKVEKIRSFDIDPECLKIADVFNAPWVRDNWRFKAITQDIMSINYSGHEWVGWNKLENRQSRPCFDVPNTIINTSCEHIQDFKNWYDLIPTGTLLILQSNNGFDIEDHVNCVATTQAFNLQTPMAKELYTGELNLPKFTRFMRIGFK